MVDDGYLMLNGWLEILSRCLVMGDPTIGKLLMMVDPLLMVKRNVGNMDLPVMVEGYGLYNDGWEW